jgi:hypothetical protein
VHTGHKKWSFSLQFWHKLGEYKKSANHTKNPYFDREIKYLDFVSGHLASAETE